MYKKAKHIPVNTMPTGIREGIFIRRASASGRTHVKEVERSHRDNGHLFMLQEKGTTYMEIDFQQHEITAPSLVYIHPSQIHRLIRLEDSTSSSWIITSENLRPEYLQLLEEFVPVNALYLTDDTLGILAKAASLCIEIYERKQEKLYELILRDSVNTLVALVTSQYLASTKSTGHYSRFEVINKAFKALLERDFKTLKSPRGYAENLNIATPYLNECVKAATGFSVSHQIQQRVVLEAKRLLYHSSKSVKEIAAELGYDDSSYFTRLFAKLAGIPPLVFRNKNFD